jgi:hypothetical protein
MILPGKYEKDDILRGLRDPRRIIKEGKYSYKSSLFKYKYWNVDKKPITKDWDNLLLLDACRYDMLQRVGGFDGEIGYKILRSSTSPEFCDEYIAGNEFHDTIYVTANSFGAQVDDSVFYKKIVTLGDDRELKVNLAPEMVYQRALDAHRDHPDKRLMVHFMQPHSPYFGEKAAELRERLTDRGYNFWVWDDELSEADGDRDGVYTHLLDAAKDRNITTDELTEIYLENLDIVLEYVKKLATEMGGKTIVTSDHGEVLRWKLGHGYGIYT